MMGLLLIHLGVRDQLKKMRILQMKLKVLLMSRPEICGEESRGPSLVNVHLALFLGNEVRPPVDPNLRKESLHLKNLQKE